MAIQQVHQVLVKVVGDGTSTAFTTSLANYDGNTAPDGVSVATSTAPVSAVTTDGQGNVTITFVSAIPLNIVVVIYLNLLYAAGNMCGASPEQPTSLQLDS